MKIYVAQTKLNYQTMLILFIITRSSILAVLQVP